MKENIPNKFQQAFILLLLIMILMAFIGMIQEFLMAIILAAIFSGLLYPFYSKAVRLFKGKAALAASSVLIVSIVAVGFPLVGLAGMVTNEAIQISQKAQPIVKEILDKNPSFSEKLPQWLPLQQKLESFDETIITKASEATSAIGKWLVSSLSSATKGTLGFFMSMFIMLYAMFYFLINGQKLLDTLGSLLPMSKDDYKSMMERGVMVTRASLKGIIIIGLVQGFLVSLAFWAAGITGMAFWGSVVFVLSAIPGLGAPLVWLPAAIYLIIIGSTGWGIAMIVWGVLVIGLIDNILRPWIVGSDAKLPDLVILISILGGITTLGPLGIIIGPVVAALLDTILNIYKKSFTNLLAS